MIKIVSIILLILLSVGLCSATITYDGTTITVTEFTFGSEGTFLDLYNADQIGGWDVVTKTGYSQYFINAYLTIGDGITETWFKDTNKQVVCHQKFLIRRNAHVQFGDVLDYDKKLGVNGCSFIFDNTGFYGVQTENSSIKLYDCNIIGKGYGGMNWMEGGVIMWSCTTNLYCGNILTPNVLNVANTISRVPTYGVSRCPVIAENWIIAHPFTYGLYFASNDIATVRGVSIYHAPIEIYCRVFNGAVDMIDCDLGDDWTVYFKRTCSGYIYRKYSFNLQSTPDSKVTIWNNEEIVYSGYTYNNGSISEQLLMWGYYKKGDKPQYNPFTITIEKKGYHTYSEEFTLDHKIDWCIRLVPDCIFVGSDIIRPLR